MATIIIILRILSENVRFPLLDYHSKLTLWKRYGVYIDSLRLL